MDIFRFTNPVAPTKMEQGIIVNGLESKLWVERYREDGEFEVTGKLDTGIRTNLPIGSFVSHTKSDDIMIVENHELTDDGEDDPIVTVSGRSFETFLENRIVGSDRTFPTTTAVPDFTFVASYTYGQAMALVQMHTYASDLVDDDNAIPYFNVVYDTAGMGTMEEEERTIKFGTVYKALLDLLEIDNLGVKTVRPYRTTIGGVTAGNIGLVIHKGIDRRASILFSHDHGEVDRADYLWSNKKVKNCAWVVGKWVDVLVDSAASEYNRRMLYVDANDMDQNQTEYPTGDALAWIRAAMVIRGKEALAKQKAVALTKAEVRETPGAEYRKDYGMGDLVSVSGGYATASVMRVTEYVEIEDDKGSRGFPTLEIDP